MTRVLTGIQSTGIPHLGNILGAIKPAITLSEKEGNESLFFIANYHSLTTIKDGNLLRENTYATAAAWLACGLNPDKTIFYRQSDVSEVCELAWFLNCITPMPMLENAHSFKDKSEKLSKDKISAGLFNYPVLMAADILLYNAELVPVGKDQKQHLEITRDLAKSFNNLYGETFTIPESKINEEVMTIPGIDGQKMSKSYDNTINIFQEDKPLRKNVMKIVTDSIPMEEPKDPDGCNVFKLYSLLAEKPQIAEMRNNYEQGNYGYGHAKQALFELIVSKFSEERKVFTQFISDKHHLDQLLINGASKAKEIANTTLKDVRKAVGY